ncbi:MAG: nucleoside hydrolase [Planctomycetaceae bacterium]|nr:nucleoside hydrolase [Planctomycetaceae bacterium]
MLHVRLKSCWWGLALFLSCILVATAQAAQPVHLIFDTDMDSDCDDVAALAILHALADRGEARILATPVSARHLWSGPCVDAINTYFGRPEIPIGIPAHTPNTQGSSFAETVAREFPQDFPELDKSPDAVDVYRKVLAEQPDGSVTLVTVGDLTNIRDVLKSVPDDISPLNGVELVSKKICLWVCMGSRYPADLDPRRWGNFKMDPLATVESIRDWPGSIVFTGGGDFANAVAIGKRLRELPAENPVRRSYELYFQGAARDRHSADPIAVLVAVRGTGEPWHLVSEGHNQIFANGTHQWHVTPDNPHHSYISAFAAGISPETVKGQLNQLMLHLPDKPKP